MGWRAWFVAALVTAGYQVFAINPMSASRHRERHGSSGAKPDPGDAKVLADLVRTDRHNHRPVAGDTHHQALRALGNRLAGILHGCLATRTLYNEDTAWAHRTSHETTRAA